MSAFCQILAFTGPEWSKITILIQILNGTENFRFYQIPSLAGPEWSKISFLNQIFKTTQNFWMLSNFFLHRSRVVKSLNLGPNVWPIWKFLDLILRMSWVFKNVNFELNFWHESKFLDFAKFHPSQVRSGQTLDFKPNFQRDWKFLDFAKFPPGWGGGGEHSHYGGDADVRLQRLPIFSAAVTQWPIFLLIVSAVTKRPHIFWWNVGSSIALTQRPPIFCIRLPQEATFCFNFIDKLIIFAIFDSFFFKFLLLKRSLKYQK